MPWKVTDVVNERTRFVLEYDSGGFIMAELCRIYGVARKTGYVWVERYEVEGLAGLQVRRESPDPVLHPPSLGIGLN
jgi:putative transposase